jgi:hypothetical protein
VPSFYPFILRSSSLNFLEARSRSSTTFLMASRSALEGVASPLVWIYMLRIYCTLISILFSKGCGFLYPAYLTRVSRSNCLMLARVIHFNNISYSVILEKDRKDTCIWELGVLDIFHSMVIRILLLSAFW